MSRAEFERGYAEGQADAWKSAVEDRVLLAFGAPKHDLTMTTDEVVDRVPDTTRVEVVGALERLSDRRVLYRFGEGRARIWRMLGLGWGGGDEGDDEDGDEELVELDELDEAETLRAIFGAFRVHPLTTREVVDLTGLPYAVVMSALKALKAVSEPLAGPHDAGAWIVREGTGFGTRWRLGEWIEKLAPLSEGGRS